MANGNFPFRFIATNKSAGSGQKWGQSAAL